MYADVFRISSGVKDCKLHMPTGGMTEESRGEGREKHSRQILDTQGGVPIEMLTFKEPF